MRDNDNLRVTQPNQLDEIANQIRAAFSTRDVTAFGHLLADDVRWGDDAHPRRCRSRADVLATFRGLLTTGVDADITEMTTGAEGVVLRLRVHWPEPEDRRRGTAIFHAYLVRDGKISEIRRYDDRRSAFAAIGA